MFASAFGEDGGFSYLRDNGAGRSSSTQSVKDYGTELLRELVSSFADICAVEAQTQIRRAVDDCCFAATKFAERAEACALAARDAASANGWDWRGDEPDDPADSLALAAQRPRSRGGDVNVAASVLELTHERRTWQLILAIVDFFLECEKSTAAVPAPASSAERALWSRVRAWLELGATPVATPLPSLRGSAGGGSSCAASDLLSRADDEGSTPPGEEAVLEDVWIMVRRGELREADAYLRRADGGRHAWRADSMRRTPPGRGANEWRWLESCKSLATSAQARGGRGGAFEQAIYASLCGDCVLLEDAQRRIARTHREIHGGGARAGECAALHASWMRSGARVPVASDVAAAERSYRAALHELQRKWPFVVADYPSQGGAGDDAYAAKRGVTTMRAAHDKMWACVHCHLRRGEQRAELDDLLKELKETAWVDGAWSVTSRQLSVKGTGRAEPAAPDSDDAAHGARTFLGEQSSAISQWKIEGRPTAVRSLLEPLRVKQTTDRGFFLAIQRSLIRCAAHWAVKRDGGGGGGSSSSAPALEEILDWMASALLKRTPGLSPEFRPGALRFAAHFALFHRIADIRFRDDETPHPLAVEPRHSMFRLIAEYADRLGDEVKRRDGTGVVRAQRARGARHVAMYAATLQDRVEGEVFSRHRVYAHFLAKIDDNEERMAFAAEAEESGLLRRAEITHVVTMAAHSIVRGRAGELGVGDSLYAANPKQPKRTRMDADAEGEEEEAEAGASGEWAPQLGAIRWLCESARGAANGSWALSSGSGGAAAAAGAAAEDDDEQEGRADVLAQCLEAVKRANELMRLCQLRDENDVTSARELSRQLLPFESPSGALLRQPIEEDDPTLSWCGVQYQHGCAGIAGSLDPARVVNADSFAASASSALSDGAVCAVEDELLRFGFSSAQRRYCIDVDSLLVRLATLLNLPFFHVDAVLEQVTDCVSEEWQLETDNVDGKPTDEDATRASTLETLALWSYARGGGGAAAATPASVIRAVQMGLEFVEHEAWRRLLGVEVCIDRWRAACAIGPSASSSADVQTCAETCARAMCALLGTEFILNEESSGDDASALINVGSSSSSSEIVLGQERGWLSFLAERWSKSIVLTAAPVGGGRQCNVEGVSHIVGTYLQVDDHLYVHELEHHRKRTDMVTRTPCIYWHAARAAWRLSASFGAMELDQREGAGGVAESGAIFTIASATDAAVAPQPDALERPAWDIALRADGGDDVVEMRCTRGVRGRELERLRRRVVPTLLLRHHEVLLDTARRLLCDDTVDPAAARCWLERRSVLYFSRAHTHTHTHTSYL